MPGFTRNDAASPPAPGRPIGWKARLRGWLSILFGDYQLFRIYECDLERLNETDLSPFRAQGFAFREVGAAELAASSDEDIRSIARYCGEDAAVFAVYRGTEIVCVQCYWFGERYRRRNFWPLESDQAKSVELFTAADYRRRGLATAVKMYSAQRMKERGFRRLFSRIWHSHGASRRVSEKAGWSEVAAVAEFTPLGLGRTVRLVRNRRGTGRA